MAKVIGVQFQKNGKVYYFEPGPFAPKAGDYVIVETDRGADLAEVVLDAFEFEPGQNDPRKGEGSLQRMPEKNTGASAGDEAGLRRIRL